MSIITDQRRTLGSLLNLGWETTLISLLWATVAVAEPVGQTEALPSNSETEVSIESLISETVSTRAKDLFSHPDEGELTAQNNSSSGSIDRRNVDPFTKSAGGQLRLRLGDPDKALTFGFGSLIGYPDALKSPTRDILDVPQLETQLSVISLKGFVRQNFGKNKNQGILFEGVADPKRFGANLAYGNLLPSVPGAFAVNVFNQNARSPTFENGEREVNLPNGSEPWVIRFGTGAEYVLPIVPKFNGAFGINYQTVSVRDGAFTNSIETEDEEGNPLTFSDDGQDTLLTLDAALLFDNTDQPNRPSRGSRLRFGMSQSIPVGDANILYNRLAAGFSQFIPLRLFGFSKGPRTLVLNFQTGTFIGDVPSYQAFNLGGTQTIRGFENGEVGTGRSFIKATAEYRFPIAGFRVFKQDIGLGGNLFVDYGNDLGTADGVRGNPAGVRNKPGNGLGYGLGLNADTPIGRFRGEFALNDDGGSQFHFAIGDRF